MRREAMGGLVAALWVAGCATHDGASGTSKAPSAAKSPSGTGDVHAMTMTAGTGGAPHTTASGGTTAAPGDGKAGGSAGSEQPAANGTQHTIGTAGMDGAADAGTTGKPVTVAADDPVVPMITGDCPSFDQSSTITFMGLAGIDVEVGAKPSMPTAPLVFYWHGTGSDAGEYAMLAAEVHKGVISEGGVLISFESTTGGDILSGTAIFGQGDFKLADQLFACAVRDHNIDPRRVYVTGCSAGALFTAAMAAKRSSYIAAAAPNNGGWTMPVPFEDDHTPKLMSIHSTVGEDALPIDFAQTSASADMAFKQRGGFVIDCDGASHCDRSLAPDIWSFFKAHPYGVAPEPWAGGLPAGFSAACKVQ